jgi:hypothetical protein
LHGQMLNAQRTTFNCLLFCHVEHSRDISGLCENQRMRDLIRSLPVRLAFGVPVYVAASQPAPFSTPLGMTD